MASVITEEIFCTDGEESSILEEEELLSYDELTLDEDDDYSCSCKSPTSVTEETETMWIKGDESCSSTELASVAEDIVSIIEEIPVDIGSMESGDERSDSDADSFILFLPQQRRVSMLTVGDMDSSGRDYDEASPVTPNKPSMRRFSLSMMDSGSSSFSGGRRRMSMNAVGNTTVYVPKQQRRASLVSTDGSVNTTSMTEYCQQMANKVVKGVQQRRASLQSMDYNSFRQQTESNKATKATNETSAPSTPRGTRRSSLNFLRKSKEKSPAPPRTPSRRPTMLEGKFKAMQVSFRSIVSGVSTTS